MRRLLSFVFLCLLGCAQLWAAPVDSVRARQVADAFRATRGASYLDAARVSSKQLGTEQVYVFNYGEQQGFVIVPANDALPPVLAYSFSSSFASDMADATRDWIDYYAASVADASSLGLDASDAVAQQWNRLLYGPAKPRKAGSVSPMLSVRWAQEPYYNRLCPEDPRSRQRVMVGCVAVAMGQIMHYWHHPLSGLGSHSYIDSVPGLLSADFHATTYLWDSMPDTLGRRSRLSQINAVSELLFHCGVSVDMAYSIDGSASYASNYGNASLPSAQNAMPRYFDYKRTIASADRSDYSDSEWQALIVSELEDGRPVIYSGADLESGGHAFVCDGYEEDFFHFNWGWGGKCDGYYMLSNLAPALTPGATPRYSFVSAQSVVYGIEPNDHLRIDTARITFPIGGGSQTVSISSNADDSQTWTASATASWLHLSATSGFGEGRRTRVVVSVDTNSTSLSRGDTIVITQGDAQVLLYVYQLPCYSHEMCQLQVEMTDRERDSWNHASLEVRDLTGATYGTATLISDLASDTAFIGICPSTVNLVWRAGVWDDEAGVVVRNSNGSMLFRHQQGSDFSTELLATISNPCAMSYDCQAANDLPWQEDFEYDIPCWVIKDADGSGRSWSVCDTLPAQSRRASIVAPADASADDWLITPSFTLPDPSYITLSWYVRSDGTQPYSIYVATDTNVRMITDLVYQGQATGSYELRMLTLSQYVGQTIRLAFRRQGTNVGNLQIDNIRLIATNTPTYQLNAVSLSPGMGTTTGTGIYEAGTHVAVRANALFGYRFAFWNDLNTDNPRSVYVDSAITLTAFFAADSFAVVAINRDSAQGHTWGSANYAYRDTATLRATPAHGYHFSQWHDGDTLNPRRVVVEGNANYTAFFAANNYYIDLQPADFMQGSVRGGGTYLYGSIIAISATPRQGYMFSRWSDGDTTNPRF
ncbi:MAG: C10 family peptidase [Bacteroidales bacterium]|nr:C10 family peptidase [Bacteroidales bacterium]